MGIILLTSIGSDHIAIIGLGWKTFTSGVITGFEKAIDIGTPIIKKLT